VGDVDKDFFHLKRNDVFEVILLEFMVLKLNKQKISGLDVPVLSTEMLVKFSYFMLLSR